MFIGTVVRLDKNPYFLSYLILSFWKGSIYNRVSICNVAKIENYEIKQTKLSQWKMIQMQTLKYILAGCGCCLPISLEMRFWWHRRYLIFFLISLYLITWHKTKVVQFYCMNLDQMKAYKIITEQGIFSYHIRILIALTI